MCKISFNTDLVFTQIMAKSVINAVVKIHAAADEKQNHHQIVV